MRKTIDAHLQLLDSWASTLYHAVRCDRVKLNVYFVFNDRGDMTAQLAESDAQRTVDDFELDRSGLRRARRVAIRLQLDTLRDVIEKGLPMETTRRLAQGLVKRAEDPKVPYSQALGQNLRRLWHEYFSDISLF